jgi:hypothetical protein
MSTLRSKLLITVVDKKVIQYIEKGELALALRIKLAEGVVVQSDKFINGICEDKRLYVGDFIENNIYNFSHGVRANDVSRAKKNYVITSCWEADHLTINGRKGRYENGFVAKELNEDGTYNESGEEIHFSTSGVYRGSVQESDINIVKVMRKTFV